MEDAEGGGRVTWTSHRIVRVGTSARGQSSTAGQLFADCKRRTIRREVKMIRDIRKTRRVKVWDKSGSTRYTGRKGRNEEDGIRTIDRKTVVGRMIFSTTGVMEANFRFSTHKRFS